LFFARCRKIEKMASDKNELKVIHTETPEEKLVNLLDSRDGSMEFDCYLKCRRILSVWIASSMCKSRTSIRMDNQTNGNKYTRSYMLLQITNLLKEKKQKYTLYSGNFLFLDNDSNFWAKQKKDDLEDTVITLSDSIDGNTIVKIETHKTN